MDKITVSAPGKLMLMGEHSVVYGYPCLAAAINQRVKFTLEKSSKDKTIDSKFVNAVVEKFRKDTHVTDQFSLTVESEISRQYGLGSSSAVTVAAAYGLHLLFGFEISKKDLFAFCKDVIISVQGVGSGYDAACAVYGGIIYFSDFGRVIEKLPPINLPLIVVYSGQKADTVTVINQVKALKNDHEEGVKNIFVNVSNLVEEGKKELCENDFERLGILWNYNQNFLEDLGVSTEKIGDLISVIKQNGGLGAKISGAGAGDCIIVLAEENRRQKIKEEAEKIGGEVLNVKIENEGVRDENNCCCTGKHCLD